MLTGQAPYGADTPMAVMLKTVNDPIPLSRALSTDISENLQQILLKGLAKDSNNRYATVRQMQEALRYATREGSQPAAPGATEILQTQQVPEPRADRSRPQSMATAKYVRYGLAVAAVAVISIVSYLALKPESGRIPHVSEQASTKLMEQQIAIEALSFGEYTQGKTTIPGQTVTYPIEYPIEAKAGQTLYFDLIEDTAHIDYTLTAPDDSPTVFNSTRDVDPVTLEQSGTFTLRVDPPNEKISKFAFVVRSDE